MGRLSFRTLAGRVAPVGVVAVLVASGCGALPSVLGAPTFQAAALAPADAWSFTDVTLRPSVQQALYARDVFNFYADQTLGGSSLKALPTPSGRTLDFEQDLLPLLDGEVAVAVSGTPQEPHGFLLIHTTNTEAVLRFLADEVDPKFTRDARGATHYANGRSETAGYKNWVVFASDDTSLAQTLDRIDSKGGPGLAAEPRYQSAVGRLSGDHVGFGYLDLTPVLQSATLFDLAQVSNALSAHGRLAYSFAFASGPEGGMRALDLRTEFISESPPPPMAADQGDALAAMDRLPVGNAVALSGPSIGQVARSLDALSNENVLPDDALTFVRAFTGPYAFGASPVPGGSLEPADLLASLFFLGQLAPDVDAVAVQELLRTIVADNLNDADTWHHEVVTADPWTAINVVPASIPFDQLQQDLLASDRLYQSIRPALSRDGSNAYVNVGALLAWGQEQGTSPDALAALGQLRAIGTSWRSGAQGDGHGRLLMVIGV